jgi:putative transposase
MSNDNTSPNITTITSISIDKGQRLTFEGNLCRVERVVDDQITLENEVSRRMTVISEKDLIAKWMAGQAAFILDGDRIDKLGAADDNLGRQFDDFPKELQERALRARSYVVDALEKMPIRQSDRHLKALIAEVAEAIDDKQPPSARTVRRWIKAWRLSGSDIRSLIPCDAAKGNREPQIPPLLASMIEHRIDDAYCRRERVTVDTLAAYVLGDLDEYNAAVLPRERLPLPSNETLSRAIRRRDPYQIAVARLGKDAADALYKPVFSTPRAEYPLHIVQIDHVRVNVLVYIGDHAVVRRAWLSAALDLCTRMIVGLHFGFDAPSSVVVMQLIRNMVSAKTHVLEKYPDIKADWPCFGLPKIILVDNGREFHSAHFRDACYQLGIEVRYCEAGRPQQKASVERIFRTFNDQYFHQIPGTTFENPTKRGDYDSKGRAVIDLDLLVKHFHRFVIDVYHRKYHRGLREVPLEAWTKGIKAHPVKLPPSVEDLIILTSKVESAEILHYGVELNDLRYNSLTLAQLRPRKGEEKKFVVRYDPLDLSRIWILDEAQGTYLEVPSTDLDYTTGLSEAEHNLVKAQAKKANGGTKVNRETRLRTLKAIFDEIRAADPARNAAAKKANRAALGGPDSPHVQMREAKRAIPPSSSGFGDMYGDDDLDLNERPDPLDALDDEAANDDVDLDDWAKRYEPA